MKHRQSRVRELMLRELGAIISREMTFDAKLVTVADVSLTPDFKHCHAHISVIGTLDEKRDAIQALGARRPLLQHELSRRVVLKFTPQLHFHLDDSIERGSKIVSILTELDVPPADDELDENAVEDEPLPGTVRATAAAAGSPEVDSEEDEEPAEEAVDDLERSPSTRRRPRRR